jgi:CRP-like cAMP-binding protein
VSLADSLGRSADVVTLQESVFLLMDREALRATAEEVPDRGRNLTRVLCRRVRLANTHSRMLCALHVPGRVATQILALAREYGELSIAGCCVRVRVKLGSTRPYRDRFRDDGGRGSHSSDLVSGAAQLAPYLSLTGLLEDPRFTLGE